MSVPLGEPHRGAVVGFTGTRPAAPVLLDGLAKLEYGGCDSAGLAVRDSSNDGKTVKAKGRLRMLAEKQATVSRCRLSAASAIPVGRCQADGRCQPDG